ncbi:MAG TPA: HAD-IA family hydrolase [Hyphomicrobiaceae bacterium]|nr:HAD-IA family hydrolase [Hyphomicrobiaceae bacterium]
MALPRVLLFDLGGVLVDSAGLQRLHTLIPAPLEAEALRRKWVTCPVVGLYESGRCSETEFAAAFIAEWGLRLTPAAFVEEFASWVLDPYPGTAKLLADLAGRSTLACLSNTNATHWRKVKAMPDLSPVLGRTFLSFQLGLMKPSPEIFTRVAREIGCAPAEIAFFDDGPENIAGAASAGLSAHHTVGPAALRGKLRDLGVL